MLEIVIYKIGSGNQSASSPEDNKSHSAIIDPLSHKTFSFYHELHVLDKVITFIEPTSVAIIL